MNAYRCGWLLTALWLGLVGLAAALAVPAALLVLAPVCAGVVLVVMLLSGPYSGPHSGTEVGPGPAATPGGPIRRPVVAAVVGGAGSAAAAGWVVLLGPGGLLLALAVAATSPRALPGWRRALGALPHPTTAQLDALARSLANTSPTYVASVSDPVALTDEQLDRLWLDSGAEVRRPATRTSWLRAVEERGCYLDLLEARRPGLLGAWLASDAGRPDDLPLLAGASRSTPAAFDWDGLTGGQATGR
jgi:hypothetical protein